VIHLDVLVQVGDQVLHRTAQNGAHVLPLPLREGNVAPSARIRHAVWNGNQVFGLAGADFLTVEGVGVIVDLYFFDVRD
jgi:hypothetical protein